MLAALLLISLILLFLIFRQQNCWRSSILSAAIVWGVTVIAITEILNLFRLITFNWLLFLWLAFNISLTWLYLSRINRKKLIQHTQEKVAGQPFLILVLGSLAFMIAAILLVALVSPPNNWDSMAYHMARVMHWIQNTSVSYYPTNYSPQLYHPPGSEFAILHLQILSGGDRFANLVQWFSMVSSIIGVSLIAKQLGADLHGQILAAVLCATIPMGILQGSSTQNDYAACFWLVCFVYYLLAVLQTKKISQADTLKIGASLGLALVTKATAYIYAFPFIVMLIILAFKRFRWRCWKFLSALALVAICINLGHYTRNLDLYGYPLSASPEDAEIYKMQAFSIPSFISNIVRNIALHLDIVRYLNLQGIITPITGISEKAILLLHKLLGIDINDPRTTAFDSFHVAGISFNEDTAGNPLHLFLIVLALTLCLTRKNLRLNKYVQVYLGCIIAGFLLFCMLIKWQPYNSRLHLYFFVMFSAWLGIILPRFFSNKLVITLALLLILISNPWIFQNNLRPLVGSNSIFIKSRIEQYFNARKYLEMPYREAVNFLVSQNCSDIGLSLGKDNWEYPLWVLFQQKDIQEFHIEHVNVTNKSAEKSTIFPYINFNPCAIINMVDSRSEQIQKKEILILKNSYIEALSVKPVFVFTKKSK